MLPGWCCIANRHIGARERRQLIPHVRFQVPFLGPESQLKSGFACAGLLCRSGSHLVSPFVLPFQLLHGSVVACNWIANQWVAMLVRLAPCDLGASGWGGPWFPCFTHNPGMAMLMMFSFSVLLLFLRHTNPEDDTTLSPLLLRLTLLNWPADHFPLLVVLLVFGWFLVAFVCFVLFRFCVCFVFSGCGCWIVTAHWTMYRSRQLNFWGSLCIAHVTIGATCNWKCWTTWRKPMGVGQKNWQSS